MSNSRHVRFSVSSLDDDVQPLRSSNRDSPPLHQIPGRVFRDLGARRNSCECQRSRMNDPADEWVDPFKAPARMESFVESFMDMTNVKSLNYESVLQFGNMNSSSADMVTREAATEEDFRFESGEEAFDATNANVGFAEYKFSLEIEGSRSRKQFTTTETTKRRTVRDACCAPSQSAVHVYKKVDTVELQTWFEGDDCYVAAADAGIVRGNILRESYRTIA
ncbi:hypothetical protein MKX08_007803 [Trichoderma sp. CBMAI-0020]|nr:hypothetical protein MKX08_007803 [Trichoderma sp. CBMAI-0020]